MSKFWFALLIIIAPLFVNAQGIKIGVDWEIPDDRQIAVEELRKFERLGVKIIQIEGIVEKSIIDEIKSRGFELWVSSGLKFTRRGDKTEQHAFEDTLTDPLYYYRSMSVTFPRYTLLEHPQIYDEFPDRLDAVLEVVMNLFQGDVDILTHSFFPVPRLSSLQLGIVLHQRDEIDNIPTNPAYVYLSQNFFGSHPEHQLRDLWQNDQLSRYTFMLSSATIFNILDANQHVETVISSFSRDKKSVVALPPLRLEESNNAVITILILIFTTLFIAIFATNANYQRSILRFMTTHNFYVNDVMMKRTRFTGAVPLSWLLIIVFGSLMMWLTSSSTLNASSLEMLRLHHPIVMDLTRNSIAGFALLFVAIIVTIQVISIIWIQITCWNRVSTSQILQLYLVPQQLIIPLVIFASLIYLNSDRADVILVLSLLTIAIVLISMPLVAMDIILNSSGKKTAPILIAPFLYSIGVIGAVYWIWAESVIGDTLRLIIQLI